jgi:predicted enzyme related to lactoylglutathione lyase
VFVIEVPNIDAAMLMVVEAGATIVHPKIPVPGVGYSAYFEDTEGNRMGLFENDESATIG